MIKTIKLNNFKSHPNTQLDLDDSRLHAVVGQNSSGKTSILQAVHYLSQLAYRPFKKIFGFDRDPQYLVTSGCKNSSVSVDGYWARHTWTASYSFINQGHSKADWYPKAAWSVDDTQGNVKSWDESLRDAPYPLPNALGHAVYLKLVSSNLAYASYSSELAPRVEYNGEGLAPTLDYLRDAEPESYKKLQELLRKVVPSVQDVTVQRAKVNVSRQRSIEVDGKFLTYEQNEEMAGQEVIFNMASGERIPAHAISEGTLLTLGLLTVILHPKRPSLLLLDDVEQGLHPKAQRELMQIFKEILDWDHNIQIIFSTHSPYIIDELEPSQVHVLNNDGEHGYTTTRRLDEHPDVERALQVLTTGEFWDAEGESWIAGDDTQNG